jgi:hypothetical protein
VSQSSVTIQGRQYTTDMSTRGGALQYGVNYNPLQPHLYKAAPSDAQFQQGDEDDEEEDVEEEENEKVSQT